LTATQGPDVAAVDAALGAGTVTQTAVVARGDRGGIPGWLGGIIGTVLLVVVWEILAVTVFHKIGSGVPKPNDVATTLWHDLGSGLYGRNVTQTLKEAATGYLGAVVLAIVLAVAFVQVPIVEKALLRIAIASYCIPIIAIGPILVFALPGDRPKAVLAGLLVFFPTLVGVVLGLVKVRLRAALPSTFAALQVAAPSAILGAIIGDLLGGTSGNGLGILLVDSEQSLDIARTWGIALVCTGLAGIAFAVTGFIGRALTPWAPRRTGP
jgi:ABC-type nitrate/sulfonate/bicarbonate transport system permease component